jgi:hypothetical protein
MPVSFNSPARNLFLLGSTGGTVVTNFFKTILDSSTDGVFIAREIAYNYSEQNYILSGFASDSQSNEFGWFEKRDYNTEVNPPTSTLDFNTRIVSTLTSTDCKLLDIHLDSNNNIIACGISNDVPWIAKYSNAGALDWTSTSNSADVAYKNVTSDSNGLYYASGNTESTDGDIAFIEKFDANGNPSWGKSATALGKHVNLNGLAANSRGHVVAAGYVEDDSRYKGYLVKIDTSTGEVMWDKTLSSSETQGIVYTPVLCEDIFIDDQDNIYVTGRLAGVSAVTRSFVMKLSPEGNIIWQRETEPHFEYYRIKADGSTGQVVVFGRYYDATGNDQGGVIAKYSRGGEVSWRRTLFSSYAGSNFFGRVGNNGGVALDADPSFYYVLYTDDDIDELSGTPSAYTFGKVSTSGNGLGPFEYDDGESETVYYDIVNANDRVGRLQDGSVRYDVSGLVTYPFNATRITFDDYATPVANKKRQMDDAGNFEYSGSPAIRPADFQELNLLGENVSDRIWTDTSGKGNNGVSSLTEPFFGAGSVSFDGTGDSISVGPLLPTSTGTAFTVDMFWRSTSNTSQTCLWEQHNSGSGRTAYFINGTNAFLISEGNTVGSFAYSDNVWYFTRVTYSAGGEIEVFVNGVSRGTGTQTVGVDNVNFVIGDRSGANESFNGYISNCRVVVGSALNGTEVPTTPLTAITGTELLTCQGDTIADASANNFTITVNGNAAPTDDGPTHNAAGYWEFDGTDNKIISGPKCNTLFDDGGSGTIEMWVRMNDVTTRQTLCSGYRSSPDRWDFEVSGGFLRGGSHDNGFFAGTTTLSTATWYHFVFTLDKSSGNGTLKTYVNAVGDTTQVFTLDRDWATDVEFGIGRRYTQTNFPLNADVGEVRIYPRALTPAQVFQNYNATKSKYINEAPDTAPKIGPGIVYGSNLLLNYDFGNRATYDDTQNYLVDNFASDTDTGEYFTDQYGKHKIYEANTNLNSIYGGSPFFSSGTYDVSVSMWMKALDTQTNRFALLDALGSPVTSTHSFIPKFANPDGGIVSHTWTNVTISSNWNFVLSNNNGDARTMQYAKPQLALKPSVGRYVKVNTGVIAPPTTVKNLSSNSFPGTINGATFNSAGYFEFDGTNDYIQSSSVMSPGSADFSVIMWYKITGTGGRGGLFERATSSPYSGWLLGQGGDLNWSASVRDASNNNAAFQYTFPTVGEWTCDAFTWDVSTQTLTPYRNGANAGTATNSGTVGSLDGNSRSPMAIGARLDSGSPQYKPMECGEVQMYTRVLTATEVSQNFNATRGKYGV